MKLSALFAQGKPTLSFEVFPPKSSDTMDSVNAATQAIARLHPDYMSVTYGAGGSTSIYTAEIASDLLHAFGITPLAHLTCVTATKETIQHQLQTLRAAGIENILALRGDLPKGFTYNAACHYRYAAELIEEIRKTGDFCIGGACYPECHPDSANSREDIQWLKEKVERGCAFLTTQMFFDNNILYRFLYKIREAGIQVPVVAGIMPVTNAKQILRICALSGTALPQRFISIVDRFGDDPDAMKQAGIAYATDQIIDLLANGVQAIHVYSMNKPEIAASIQANLSHIIPRRHKNDYISDKR